MAGSVAATRPIVASEALSCGTPVPTTPHIAPTEADVNISTPLGRRSVPASGADQPHIAPSEADAISTPGQASGIGSMDSEMASFQD